MVGLAFGIFGAAVFAEPAVAHIEEVVRLMHSQSIQPDRHSHALTISQDLNLNRIADLMFIKRTEKVIRVCDLLSVYPEDNIAELSVTVFS